MTQFVSVIDEAFKAFVQNYTNEEYHHCRIGKIKIGTKTIDPNMFKSKLVGRNGDQKNREVWD